MNLKSFIIRSDRGIFTVTNVQTVRQVVYKPRATQRENRWGEIVHQGYGDKEKYQYSSDLTEVYHYVLLARHGKTEIIVMHVPTEAHGRELEEFIWSSILFDQKLRMIDLTNFRPNMIKKEEEED